MPDPRPSQSVALAVVVLVVFLAMAGMIALMKHYRQPGPVDQNYWAERQRNLEAIHAQSHELLHSYGWVNQEQGITRLPLDRALELTATEWQSPAAARSNLLARLARAVPPVPTTAPTSGPAATQPAPRAPGPGHGLQ